MLHWAAGRRESDGVWAPACTTPSSVRRASNRRHLVSAVTLGSELQRIADAARPHYEALAKYKLW